MVPVHDSNEFSIYEDTPLPEVSPVSSSFALSPENSLSTISPRYSPAIAIEISQSPSIRSLSRENLINRRVIFTRPPNANLDSGLSQITPKSIVDAEQSTELSLNTTQSMFDPISPTSISDHRMTTNQILELRNVDFSIRDNKNVENTPSPNPKNNVMSINHQRNGELSIPPPQDYFPGTQKPLTNRSIFVPISREAQVAMRIKTDKKSGEKTCSF